MRFLPLLLLLLLCHVTLGARILGLFFYPGKSHFLVFQPLLEALALRGHEVRVVSFFPRAQPLRNYVDVSIQGAVPLKTANYSMAQWHAADWETVRVQSVWKGGVAMCDAILQHPNVKAIIASEDEYDLLITEVFGSECQLGFSYRFQIPTVVMFSSKPFSWNTDPLGSPEHPAYVPSTQFAYPDSMSFSQRLSNTWYWVKVRVGFWYYSQRPSDAVARKHFGGDMPPLSEIAKNTSLLLVNQHFSANRAKPMVPGVVEVGGLHIGPVQPLPEELDAWLNDATDGVVYFSMGSMLRADSFPADKLAALVAAFGALPQRVLWKWEGEEPLPGRPSNVRTDTWLPQRDVLAHPKVRVFVTHGGLLGTMEAVDSGVPMVGIPVFGDQHHNMRCYVTDGVAEVVDYELITKETVLQAINKVINDERYAANAKHLSRIFRDRPLSPLETATYWTEYVIRHKGAPHMRSPAASLPWYQYLLLDVAALVLLLAHVGMAGVVLIGMLVVRIWRARRGEGESGKQSKSKRA